MQIDDVIYGSESTFENFHFRDEEEANSYIWEKVEKLGGLKSEKLGGLKST